MTAYVMNLKPIFLREEIIKSIRQFFYARNFHEAVIPVLNTALPLEQNIYAFKAIWNTGKGDRNFYLSTSPEARLKKLIAWGIGNCFAIGHTFRNLEDSGNIHSPEFLMLEWYRENATYRDIMREARALILSIYKAFCKSTSCKECRDGINFHNKWKVFSMVDLFKKYAKWDLEELCHAESVSASGKILKPALTRRGRRVQDDYNIKGATWEQIFNQIFLNEVEAKLPREPFFLTDYPAKISPLCAKRHDKPYLAERFELYIDGKEIANGNTENTDVEDVIRSMKKEEKFRKKMGILSPPIDMEFIESLRKMHGKSYAGIGLGIDRLAMVLGNVEDINQFT